MLRIVADGAIDMPPDWERAYDINVLPLNVAFGNEMYLQGKNFTHQDFYRLVEEKRMIPKTSLPSIGQVQEFLRSIANPGDTILSINISSKLSGTFSTVETAARDLSEDFKIIVFDTLAGSAAQAFMAREARLLDRAGAALPEIVERLEKIRQRVNISFTLDTLDFAYLNGRINALQNLVAAAFQVKPIIELRDGLLEITDKVRTRHRALERVVQKLCDHVGGRPIYAAVLHAADPETAQTLYQTVRERLNVVESFIGDVAIPIAANLGPRAIGVVAYPIDGLEQPRGFG
jgi:DegV family protein with EDD domain